ncbi:MAG: hypothetical protein RI932_2376 [Pseudomonadota bacterium]|jgi:hypothetical protein
MKSQSRGLVVMLAAIVISASGCGKKDSGTAACSGGYQIESLCFKSQSNANFVFNSGALSGTGSAVAVEPLSEKTDGGRNISISFSVQDGGSLVLRTFAKNDLSSGIDIKFSRSSSKLNMSFIQGETISSAKELEGIDASTEIKLLVDVHNDESPAHIVVWSGAGSFNKEQPLHDSEDSGAIQPAAQGVDKYWGIALDKATLSKVAVGEPKDEE